MQNVIQRFINARKSLHLTQAELAIQLGFKQSYISNIEKGRNEVTANIIIQLYKTFNISPDWLITGEGKMLSVYGTGTTAGPILEVEATNDALVPSLQQEIDQVRTLLTSLQQTIDSQIRTIEMQEKLIHILEQNQVNRLA